MKFQFDSKTVIAVVFFIIAMALLAASARTTTMQVQRDDQERSALIPADQAQPAMNFSLPIVANAPSDGSKTVDLFDTARKTPVVFSFWASYCEYCPLEMTHLQTYAQLYKGRVQFFTVNSNDSPQVIKEYMRAHAFTLPALCDMSHQVGSNYEIDSLPTLFMVDTKGRVRKVEQGYDPQMDTVFPQLLNDLISGT